MMMSIPPTRRDAAQLGIGRILNGVLVQIAEFVEHHEEHAGFVRVSIDVCPNVVRFDCDHPDCSGNLQIKYEAKE